MTDRRQILKAGLVGGVLPLGALASAAEAAQPLAIYRAVYDRRLAAGHAFAKAAISRGWTTAAIEGDVTQLWFEDLDLRWRKGPAPIAGVTRPESLFVLDHLARGAGMRVITRSDLPHEGAISWLIAPSARRIAA